MKSPCRLCGVAFAFYKRRCPRCGASRNHYLMVFTLLLLVGIAALSTFLDRI